MRSVLVFLFLLSAQTTTMSDEVVHVKVPMAVAQAAQHGVSPHSSSTSVRARHMAAPLAWERALMALLAMTALGFQIRRKYKASQRMWRQRVIDPIELREPPIELHRVTFGMSSTARWQQIH
jgi:hypothetical protein